ncbi:MAG: hypothetical protein L0211_11595 [Planctomycetaceae bacterium]|nr:hypothetical protein [Planctomycetaceae bacterium]
MTRGFPQLAVLIMASLFVASYSSGCAICCAPYDDYYPAIGGRWVRDNPTHGRVGSAFEPAGHKVDDLAVSVTEPTPAQAAPQTIAPRRDGASYLPTEE